jgi:hypothetical protein
MQMQFRTNILGLYYNFKMAVCRILKTPTARKRRMELTFALQLPNLPRRSSWFSELFPASVIYTTSENGLSCVSPEKHKT